MSDDLDLYFDLYDAVAELESPGGATARKKWIRTLSRKSGELASLLEAPPGNLAISFRGAAETARTLRLLEKRAIELQEAAKYQKKLEEERARNPSSKLAQQADSPQGLRAMGRAIIRKHKGNSPQDRLIAKLAEFYAAQGVGRASITRVDSSGKKGGPFYNFVVNEFVSRRRDAPSAETVARALRVKKSSRESKL